MIQRIVKGSNCFAYVCVQNTTNLIGSIALLANVKEAEILAGMYMNVIVYVIYCD